MDDDHAAEKLPRAKPVRSEHGDDSSESDELPTQASLISRMTDRYVELLCVGCTVVFALAILRWLLRPQVIVVIPN